MERHETEDIYELSPVQHGMLFHCLYSTGSRNYFVQLVYELERLNAEAFRRAWRQVVDRHSVLRTAFVWEDMDRPLQIVYRNVDLPLVIENWEEATAEQQSRRLHAFLDEDRARGLALSVAPLMRLTLIRLNDRQCYFVWSFHHMIMDGWSKAALVREVSLLYEAYCRSKEIELPTPRPYRDYIIWLQQRDLSRAEQYWKRRLQGFTHPTKLRIQEQPGEPFDGYAEEEVSLGEEVTAELTATCRHQRITMNTVVQGAWAVLLSRYSNEVDVVYGTIVSGRPSEMAGVEEMVGVFINTLPVRARVDGEMELGEWLRALQQQLVETRDYEYSPLIKVHGWSDIERGLPLFDTLLVFENYPDFPISAAPHDGGEENAGRVRRLKGIEQTNYPITVVVGSGSELIVRVSYNTQFYQKKSIQSLLRHYLHLVQLIGRNSRSRLGELSMLSTAETEQIIVEWNSVDTASSVCACVHQAFEAQVKSRPDSVAVTCEEEQLSYAGLNRRANQLARCLIDCGVEVESPIAIFLNQSADMIVAMLAILKAGGAYVPIDSSYPKKRIVFMLEDSGAQMIITERALLDKLPADKTRTVCVDSDRDRIVSKEGSDLQLPTAGDNLAYVMYTSGSTGQPKGVSIQHRGIIRLAVDTNYVFIGPSERVAQVSNASFDAVTFEVWAALLQGGQVVEFSKDMLLAPQVLAEQIRKHGIDTIFLTPGLLNQIAFEAPQAFSPVKNLMFGGDAADLRGIREVTKSNPPQFMINGYGPTESTTFAVCHFLGQLTDQTTSIPIGRPITDTQAYIVDKEFHPSPVGVLGELYIGGGGLARGYAKRPELTADKFIPSPFGKQYGRRLYKTGDRACYLPGGIIEFLGRGDNQVKVRGFRIELSEIELALREHPGLRQAVVLACKDEEFDKVIVAFVVPRQEGLLEATELNQFLAERLPDYMIPTRYVVLDALPLTPNGKVDYRSLANRESPESGSLLNRKSQPFVGPGDSIELELVRLWEQVFGVSPIGVTDDFFDLGGHSFIAMRLMSQVYKKFGQTIPISILFETRTIRRLATSMRRRQVAAERNSCLVPIQPHGTKTPIFAVHPFGGNVFCYYPLAKHLGTDQPFYGFEAPGLRGEQDPLDDFRPMAAHYLNLIKGIQPQGPYLLCGWSLGGVIAFELAQQLHRCGDSTALLAVFDGRLNNSPQFADLAVGDGDEVNYADLLVGAFGMDIPLTAEQLKQLDTEQQLLFTMEMLKRAEVISPDFTLEQARPWVKVLHKNDRAYMKYDPQPYHGTISLFLASEQKSDISSDPSMGWERIAAGGLHVYTVPGNHKTMMINDDNAKTLANRLKSCIAEVENR
jgi:amino acid adenylation domain-containing protein